MVNEAENAPKLDNFYNEDDERWLQQVFSSIPKSIYYDQSSSKGKQEQKTKKGKSAKGAKKEAPKKTNKRRKRKETLSLANEEGEDRKKLREKLKQKIMEKRTERKADDDDRMQLRSKRKLKRVEVNAEKSKKLKRDQKTRVKSDSVAATSIEAIETKKADSGGNSLPDGKRKDSRDSEATLETTRIEGLDSEDKPKRTKRRKLRGNKLVELQMQLEKARTEQEKKDNAVKDTVKARFPSSLAAVKASEESAEMADGIKTREIEKAMQRARGVAVKDDVGRLKKTIRKEKRKHEKSKEDWAKRVNAVEEEKKSRQERREKNLKERKENQAKGKKKGQAKKKKHRKGK